jgi:hypothetical protein
MPRIKIQLLEETHFMFQDGSITAYFPGETVLVPPYEAKELVETGHAKYFFTAATFLWGFKAKTVSALITPLSHHHHAAYYSLIDQFNLGKLTHAAKEFMKLYPVTPTVRAEVSDILMAHLNEKGRSAVLSARASVGASDALPCLPAM